MEMPEIARLNQILLQAVEEMAEGVKTLIGEPVQCPNIDGKALAGNDLGTILNDKVVLSRLEVSGDWSGDAFLLTEIKTAIILGGKLIMLPEDQLAERLSAKNFDGELADAFGEISNIVTSILNSTPLLASGKIHFVRKEVKLEKIQGDLTATLPAIGAKNFYCATTPIVLQQEEIGKFRFLIPADLVGIDVSPTQPAAATAPPKESTSAQTPMVMVVSEDPQEGMQISAMIEKCNCRAMQIKFQDDPKRMMNGRDVEGVLLLMRKLDDQGTAATIKLRAAINPSIPIIAACPGWTKKGVLQVIKYGAQDVLISPISENDLQEILQKHLLSKHG